MKTVLPLFGLFLIAVLCCGVRCQKPDSAKQSLAIKSITTDQTLLTLPCPPGIECDASTPSSTFLINVVVKPAKLNRKISYSYSTTGGKVMGAGTKVLWDMTGVRPGKYEITVQALRDGKPISMSKSATVYVVSGICICDCLSCPLITINANHRSIVPGDSVSISATVTGGSQDLPLTLNWTASAGEIISGQGTDAILIKLPSNIQQDKLVVTLTIGGFPRTCTCPTSQSETFNVKR